MKWIQKGCYKPNFSVSMGAALDFGYKWPVFGGRSKMDMPPEAIVGKWARTGDIQA
jgi:hypothetical protein